MSTARLRVIAYDIVSNRRRAAVAGHLENVAVRVQQSVYEARLTDRASRRLVAEIDAMLDAEDRLRLYTVPDRSLSQCYESGGPAIADGARFWLL